MAINLYSPDDRYDALYLSNFATIFVRDSILLPKKQVVAGFNPIMPAFAGQIAEEDIAAIIEYLRSTGDVARR